jgi:hypothetical protein
MELTYKIRGSDGDQYGPATAEQFRAWAEQGRVGGDTQVLRSDSTQWVAAAQLPELGVATPGAAPAPPVHAQIAATNSDLEQRIRSGASWFYWIAALSLINSFLVMTKQTWGFAIGLGITRQIDYELSHTPMVAFGLDLLATGTMAFFGHFAIKRHAWAFIIGLVLLVMDTALTIYQQAWLSVAFHVWAIVSIGMAFKASRALKG